MDLLMLWEGGGGHFYFGHGITLRIIKLCFSTSVQDMLMIGDGRCSLSILDPHMVFKSHYIHCSYVSHRFYGIDKRGVHLYVGHRLTFQ